MADPLPTPKNILGTDGESQVNAENGNRQEGSDRDTRLMTLIGLMLLLAALAFYKLADLIASACWACG